jgi:hypothetical protein
MSYAWFRWQSLPVSRSAKWPIRIAHEVLIEQRTDKKAENDAYSYQHQHIPRKDSHSKHCPNHKPNDSNNRMSDEMPVHFGSPLRRGIPVAAGYAIL